MTVFNMTFVFLRAFFSERLELAAENLARTRFSLGTGGLEIRLRRTSPMLPPSPFRLRRACDPTELPGYGLGASLIGGKTKQIDPFGQAEHRLIPRPV